MSTQSLRTRLFEPVSNASLVLFRVTFGGIMLWEVFRYFEYGWIQRYFMDPGYHFTFPGFGWVTPWAGDGMILHFIILGILATFIMIGLFYRASTILFFLGFSYVFLLEYARYLNHFYLVILISFLICFLPLAARGSLDSLLRGTSARKAPAWTLWLVRFQIGVVYFFGGIAKLNPDWIRGEPMRSWFSGAEGMAFFGSFIGSEASVLFMSWFGLLFDLLVVPALLWRKTRVWAFALAVMFHLSNAFLFSIGIFPWFMIAATTIFFEPDWPARALRAMKTRLNRWGATPASTPDYDWTTQEPDHAPAAVPVTPPLTSPAKAPITTPLIAHIPMPGRRTVISSLLAVWVLFQVLVPLRHLLYPGYVSWTEEGHDFAWHMKLRSKQGYVTYLVTYEDGSQDRVSPEKYLTNWQESKMAEHPFMIQRFAEYLEEILSTPDKRVEAIYAESMASLNARPPAPLIDPFVDLTTAREQQARWIMPLPPLGVRPPSIEGKFAFDE